MPLMPKRVKYRKSQRRRRRGIATSGNVVCFGEHGLQALENAWFKNTQIEAARVSLARHTHRGGKVWIRVFPDKSITKQAAETRMGKGKGAPEAWVAVIKRGRVIMEIEGLPEEMARDAMRLAASKLPFKTKFVSRRHH